MAEVRVPETYRFRLMVYELRVGRSRWYGAALAAAIAYIVARQVNDPIALTMVTAAIILAGTCLAMQLLVYENAALQLRWLIDAKWVSPDDPLAGSRRAHPVWGSIFLFLTWQIIGQIGIVIVVDRACGTFPNFGTCASNPFANSLTAFYFAGVFAGGIAVFITRLIRERGRRNV